MSACTCSFSSTRRYLCVAHTRGFDVNMKSQTCTESGHACTYQSIAITQHMPAPRGIHCPSTGTVHCTWGSHLNGLSALLTLELLLHANAKRRVHYGRAPLVLCAEKA